MFHVEHKKIYLKINDIHLWMFHVEHRNLTPNLMFHVEHCEESIIRIKEIKIIQMKI